MGNPLTSNREEVEASQVSRSVGGGHLIVMRVTETTPTGHFSRQCRISTMFSLDAYATLTCITRSDTRVTTALRGMTEKGIEYG